MSILTPNPSKEQEKVGISLCIPSSVISAPNASNLEHITHIAYQIAKAATIYNVSEIVILEVIDSDKSLEKVETIISEAGNSGNKKIKFDSVAEDRVQSLKRTDNDKDPEDVCKDDSNAFLLASILQFFITPRYLVKSVFRTNPCKSKFKYAEKLPKITTLPYMNKNRVNENFREGFTVAKKAPKLKKKGKRVAPAKKLKVTKYVNVGGSSLLTLNGPEVPTNVRVTVDIKNKKIVSPESAYGISSCKASFGYHVRLAKSVTSVFTQLSHPEGYTESIFVNADNYFEDRSNSQIPEKNNEWTGRILMLIGNLRDFDNIFKQEKVEGVEDISDMFDAELRIPRGLRIEDAALVSLARV